MENITGEKPVSSHTKSIVLTFFDPLVRQHTAYMHGKFTNYEVFRQRCLQFINNVTGGSVSAMQIGAVSQSEMPLANESQCWPCKDEPKMVYMPWAGLVVIAAVLDICLWECPSKSNIKGAM